MSLEVTSDPSPADVIRVVEGTRTFNLRHMPKDVEPLCIFDRLDNGELIAGLTGKTFWNYLDISFLWVSDPNRNQGRATAIMHAAENEAIRRGCQFVLLDTYSFQALGFYEKLGYSEYGTLDQFYRRAHSTLSPQAAVTKQRRSRRRRQLDHAMSRKTLFNQKLQPCLRLRPPI